MNPIITINGLVAPLDRANIDTDAIIPKQFMKSVMRTGFGKNLFDEWRYLDHGEPDTEHIARRMNPDFILNREPYKTAEILLTRGNFGCGSSREHAVWALQEFGFKAIIAPSFADIFFQNSVKNGLLPIVLGDDSVNDLMEKALSRSHLYMIIDLAKQNVTTSTKASYSFEIDQFKKGCLLNGLDEISLTLQETNIIKEYELKRLASEPWIFQKN
jgi:3-isopropylmalate/(R)-2-methylmalate dehydratase small subunit